MPKGVFDRRQKTTEERLKLFWEKVDKKGEDECWEWIPNQGKKVYGYFWNGKKSDGAHRFSLEISLGRELQEGECALHHCDNPPCVNPKHLFVGTGDDNSKDMVSKGRKEKGEDVHGAIYTNDEILLIRKLAAEGHSAVELAERFNTSDSNIGHIIRGNTWKHIGGPIRTEKLTGGVFKGESNSRSVLTDDIVRSMRNMRKEHPEMTVVEIAAKHGVNKNSAYGPINGRGWKHVKGD